ncbi:MAG: hypothetical protein AB7Q42_10905 [Acidimicrobiia bacterium]
MRVQLPLGAASGVGSLPHRDASSAARFVLEQLPSLPAIPTLPKRSPAEGLIAQGVIGIRGVTLGQYGSLAVDVRRVDPLADVETRFEHEAFAGLRAFLEHAAAVRPAGPVKWQFVGPITLGTALMRAGVPANVAFEVAVRAVREHVQAIHRRIAESLPGCPQVVVLDEPSLPEMMDSSFPLAPDAAIDLLSGALAAVENDAVVGVHCCGAPDWASVIAAGPSLLSLPVRSDLIPVAGYLSRFLEGGGWIAWGTVATDGPMPASTERPWRELSSVWCDLVAAGCDPLLLRQRAIITPMGGLGLHSEFIAARVFRIVREISDRVGSQAVAAQMTLGA